MEHVLGRESEQLLRGRVASSFGEGRFRRGLKVSTSCEPTWARHWGRGRAPERVKSPHCRYYSSLVFCAPPAKAPPAGNAGRRMKPPHPPRLLTHERERASPSDPVTFPTGLTINIISLLRGGKYPDPKRPLFPRQNGHFRNFTWASKVPRFSGSLSLLATTPPAAPGVTERIVCKTSARRLITSIQYADS